MDSERLCPLPSHRACNASLGMCVWKVSLLSIYLYTLMSSASSADLVRIILSVLVPPLGVFLQEGLGTQFWLNVLLTLLGYIPGLVHAVWIIARR